MVRKKTSWLVPLVLGLVACSGGDPVDIGDDKVVKTGETLSDYAAVWEGYAEAFEFNSGSDRIRVVLDEHGEGTFEVGEAEPLPPPSDPDVGYPPGGVGPAAPVVPGGLYSGFSYTVRAATVEDRRLRLGVMPREVHKQWCELQTPILDEFNSTPEQEYYYCVPNWSSSSGGDNVCSQRHPDGGPSVPIDCGKLGLCEHGGACYCTADGCGVYEGDDRYVTTTLDAALAAGGNELEGTLVVDTSRLTIRMTRQ